MVMFRTFWNVQPEVPGAFNCNLSEPRVYFVFGNGQRITSEPEQVQCSDDHDDLDEMLMIRILVFVLRGNLNVYSEPLLAVTFWLGNLF
jgi:hypothetical protein